jgi:hypothetical protein
LISKNGWPVGLANRAQKNNTEKQRRNYFLDAGIGFIFSVHTVKIRVSPFKTSIQLYEIYPMKSVIFAKKNGMASPFQTVNHFDKGSIIGSPFNKF